MMVMKLTRRKTTVLISMLGAIAVLCSAAWIGFRYMDSKSMACECEDPVDNPRFAILNPFRDRAPEKVAIQVIEAIEAGRCPASLIPQRYCEEEKYDKITAWKLTGRYTKGDAVTIRFWVSRGIQDKSEFGDPFWVTLEPQGKSWSVTTIDTYY